MLLTDRNSICGIGVANTTLHPSAFPASGRAVRSTKNISTSIKSPLRHHGGGRGPSRARALRPTDFDAWRREGAVGETADPLSGPPHPTLSSRPAGERAKGASLEPYFGGARSFPRIALR